MEKEGWRWKEEEEVDWREKGWKGRGEKLEWRGIDGKGRKGMGGGREVYRSEKGWKGRGVYEWEGMMDKEGRG